MLVVSRERYLPVTVNTLVLYAHESYFYIHRDVYDQAIILSDRYESLDELAALVGGYEINGDTVQWFYANAPKPLHILAPYLSLIDGEIEQDMELCCGVLHVITSLIHVRHFIQKPQEVRKSVSFSLSIKEEYEMAWDRFFMTALPYDQRNVVYGQKAVEGTNGTSAMLPDVESLQEPYPINNVPIAEDIVATSILEGFSHKREELVPESAPSPMAASNAERKATKSLLV